MYVCIYTYVYIYIYICILSNTSTVTISITVSISMTITGVHLGPAGAQSNTCSSQELGGLYPKTRSEDLP